MDTYEMVATKLAEVQKLSHSALVPCKMWWDGSGKCRLGFDCNCTTDPCMVSRTAP